MPALPLLTPRTVLHYSNILLGLSHKPGLLVLERDWPHPVGWSGGGLHVETGGFLCGVASDIIACWLATSHLPKQLSSFGSWPVITLTVLLHPNFLCTIALYRSYAGFLQVHVSW